MALFKTFRGKRADLGAQELRDGFAYFCTDDGTFHIDFLDTDGTVKRKQINAKDAETLLGHSIEEFLIASENGSFAHGEGSVAAGTNSYAGGQEVLAFGTASHAEGDKTEAKGYASHAGGQSAAAYGDGSFAHGAEVTADAANQFVVGQYNKEDPDALFIVGGGDSEENRKNLFTVKKDGSIIGLNTSNALTKTVSGEAIAISDASPIEHEMDVRVQKKNVFDASKLVIGGIAAVNGTDWVTENDIRSDYCEVEPDTTYNFGGGSYAWNTCHAYDKDKKWIKRITAISGGNFITPKNAAFVRFTLCKSDHKAFTNEELEAAKQEPLWVSSTATAYTPYIEDFSTVKVKKYGKNILDVSTAKLIATQLPNRFTKERTQDGIKTTVVGNRTFTATAYAGYRIGSFEELKGKTLTVSFGGIASDASLEKRINAIIYDDSHSNYENDGYVGSSSYYRIITYANNIVTFTVPTEADARYNNVGITLAVYPGGVALQDGNVTEYTEIQVEIGDSATGFEPSKGVTEYEVTADGTVKGVISLYPTTTLMTDTAGAIIDCTYNRDINRVLDDTGFMYDNNPVGTGSFSMNRKVGSEVGDYSFTEGFSATATGRASHAGGEASQAKGVGSFAHGQRVTADADYQATFGTHNEVNTNAALIVGNGVNSTSKNNAFEVQKDGNTFVKGDLYIGGTGSTQASAKQVATKDSLSAMEQRINNLEDITSSTGGVFFEDADVAYVKTIPENIAPYASLNKVGGMGIYKKKLANLIPSTYETANGTVSGYHTFNSNADGVITIVDRTPVEEWTSEPWFSAEISLNTIELPAGTYTATIYADNPEGSPFGLCISGVSEDIHVGGAWGYYYSEQPGNPVTFVLTETTSLDLSLKFECGGSRWVPTGDTEVCHFRIMLNEGNEAMPWEPYSSSANIEYVPPAKVTSVDVVGKNVFDYGMPRALGKEVYEEVRYYSYHAIVSDNGYFDLETFDFDVNGIGPGSESGNTIAIDLEGINTTRMYPAGTYSISSPVSCGTNKQDKIYLALSIRLLESNTVMTNLIGSNILINEPFTITNASIIYQPATLSRGIANVSIPLTLVKGTTPLDTPTPYTCTTIQIPESIVSRDDYGLGILHSQKIYCNHINFETKQLIKECLAMDLIGTETDFNSHLTSININLVESTLQCSDPQLTCEYHRWGPDWCHIIAYFSEPGDAEEYIVNARKNGTPIRIFFGTNIPEKIDISAELAGIDNYIPVEAGGLIYFNNDRQEAVPGTIEYQSMMKKGEIEEL